MFAALSTSSEAREQKPLPARFARRVVMDRYYRLALLKDPPFQPSEKDPRSFEKASDGETDRESRNVKTVKSIGFDVILLVTAVKSRHYAQHIAPCDVCLCIKAVVSANDIIRGFDRYYPV